MVSDFLGNNNDNTRGAGIISSTELIAREGMNLQKGMNYRDKGPLLSVFLVLPRDDEYRDSWDEKARTYEYEGHESTTVEGGKAVDQLLMYESGRLTDNGKFYKAAHAYKDGVRKEPMQIQVYEKLDSGVWFDKGIFDLVDAKRDTTSGRTIFRFVLNPIGLSYPVRSDTERERMLPAASKAIVWLREGACNVCGEESGVRFVGLGTTPEDVHLYCDKHSGRQAGGLL